MVIIGIVLLVVLLVWRTLTLWALWKGYHSTKGTVSTTLAIMFWLTIVGIVLGLVTLFLPGNVVSAWVEKAKKAGQANGAAEA